MTTVSNVRAMSVGGWKNAGHFLPGVEKGWERLLALSFLKIGVDFKGLRRACREITSQAKE